MIRSTTLPVIVTALALPLVACGGSGDADPVAADEREFAALQARGEQAMGVDQYTSTHLFDALPDGGRIELQRDTDDPAGIATIREHLREVQAAFSAGVFSTPAFVHSREVPGTAIMAEKKDHIEYVYRDLPRGGELRLVSSDPEAIQAIHDFMAFQRSDHRAGGMDHSGMNHSGMDHSAVHSGAAGAERSEH
jgi:hypothetical protein